MSFSFEIPARIEAARSAFLGALRSLAAARTWDRSARALLAPDPGGLRLEIGSAVAHLPAVGVWRVEATLARRYLLQLAEAPPPDDPIAIHIAGDHCFLGPIEVPCRWAIARGAVVSLPADATDAELLAFAETTGRAAALDAEGRERLHRARFARELAVARAAEALAPFGVAAPDLERLLRQKLRPAKTPPPDLLQGDLFEK